MNYAVDSPGRPSQVDCKRSLHMSSIWPCWCSFCLLRRRAQAQHSTKWTSDLLYLPAFCCFHHGAVEQERIPSIDSRIFRIWNQWSDCSVDAGTPSVHGRSGGTAGAALHPGVLHLSTAALLINQGT